jgi:hypothetical protein
VAVRQATNARSRGRVSSGTPPSGPPLLWDADFTGATGTLTTVKSADWNSFGADTSHDFAKGPPRSSNAFIDSATGDLVLRSKRESPTWQGEGGQFPLTDFSGAWVGTAAYGGWPISSTNKKHDWPIPFAIEASMTYPDMPGGWGGLWMMPSNKNASTQGVVEIDWGEERMALPTQNSGHQHWTGDTTGTVAAPAGPIDVDKGTSGYPYDVPAVSTELRNTSHVWRCEVLADTKPRYYFDGSLIGTGPEIRNAPNSTGALQTDLRLFLMIDWRQAPIGRWGSGDNSTGPSNITGTTPSTINLASHGMANGQEVYFSDLIGGSGLSYMVSNTSPTNPSIVSLSTKYFVINAATSTFQVSTTLNGSAATFTTNISSGNVGKVGVNIPATSDNGPWDLHVHYIRVYDLS